MGEVEEAAMMEEGWGRRVVEARVDARDLGRLYQLRGNDGGGLLEVDVIMQEVVNIGG